MSDSTDKTSDETPKPTFLQSLTMMPRCIPFIVGNEAAERFSFYGMRTILVVFMTQYLLKSTGANDFMSEHEANVWYHNFVAAVYFTPLFGAILADWLFGKYRMILSLSIVYCIGHLMLAFIDLSKVGVQTGIEPRTYLFLGLALIAIGSGGIKPCVSANVGDQFEEKNKYLIPVVFSLFYFSINFGSFFSTLLTPYLLKYHGPGWAFGVPGIFMAIATIVFWLGSPYYKKVPPAGDKFFAETFSKDGLMALLYLIPLFLFVSMFWALFDQTGSSWVHQAKSMNRMIGSYELLPDQIQAANPLLIMLMIPLFNVVVYPALNNFMEMTPLRKIGLGMFFTVISFLIPGWIELQISQDLNPHIIWQVVAYTFLTAAEMMVSISCLEFSYTQAPPKMKSFVMGLYLMSVTVGNLFAGEINHIIDAEHKKGNTKFLSGADYYWFFAGCMLATSILYLIYSLFYRGKTYLQEENKINEIQREDA